MIPEQRGDAARTHSIANFMLGGFQAVARRLKSQAVRHNTNSKCAAMQARFAGKRPVSAIADAAARAGVTGEQTAYSIEDA